MSDRINVTRASVEGGSSVWEFPATAPVKGLNRLEAYAAELTDQLKVGQAQIVIGEVARDAVPVAIAVGGWPVEGPCCVASPPLGDDLVAPEPDSFGWACPGCGEVVRPDHWAHMRLGDPQLGEWLLPPTRMLAKSCDAAAKDLLAANDHASAARARHVLELLSEGGIGAMFIDTDAWSPANTPQAQLGSVRALIGPREDDRATGRVIVGYMGVDWHTFDHDSKCWSRRWREVGTTVLDASQAFGLLWADPQLTDRAAAGTLDVDELHAAWAATVGTGVPDWVHDAAAVETLAAALNRAHGRAVDGRAGQRLEL